MKLWDPRRNRPCRGTVLLVLAAACLSGQAQVPSATGQALLSHSGQFVVHAPSVSPTTRPAASPAPDRSLVRLEPALVSVSCERVRNLLMRELGSTAPWRGKIYLELRPAREASPAITITSEHFKNGWQYRVDLPDLVARDRYVRALVNVLLLELANRKSNERQTQIPLWLAEGLSERLLSSNEMELIVPPPQETINGLNVKATRATQRMGDALERARAQLGNRQPLSFDQLSWQTEDQLPGAAADLYRASAQLFVAELLRLPNGKAALHTMLTRLPQFYNWQLAFLEAFRPSFQRALDVEKWWALCCVQSPQQEAAQARPLEGKWEDLDQALRTAAPVRSSSTAEPPGTLVTLQTMIRRWDRVNQTQALSAKVQQLAVLRQRLPADLAVLAQEYSRVIQVYLEKQTWSKPVTLVATDTRPTRVAEETLQRLDALDARREALRPSPPPLAVGKVTEAPEPQR